MLIAQYPLEVTEIQYIKMPSMSQILTVSRGVSGRLFLYALVDNDMPVTKRVIKLRYAGTSFDDMVGEYIGTFEHQLGSTNMWHAFDLGEAQ